MLRPPRTKVQIGQPLNKISPTVDKSPLLVADRLQRLYTGHGAVAMTAVTPSEKKNVTEHSFRVHTRLADVTARERV